MKRSRKKEEKVTWEGEISSPKSPLIAETLPAQEIISKKNFFLLHKRKRNNSWLDSSYLSHVLNLCIIPYFSTSECKGAEDHDLPPEIKQAQVWILWFTVSVIASVFYPESKHGAEISFLCKYESVLWGQSRNGWDLQNKQKTAAQESFAQTWLDEHKGHYTVVKRSWSAFCGPHKVPQFGLILSSFEK